MRIDPGVVVVEEAQVLPSSLPSPKVHGITLAMTVGTMDQVMEAGLALVGQFKRVVGLQVGAR